MRIEKVLNHNSVVVRDKDRKEMILTGKGIAYGYKRGDKVNPDLIDKEFVLLDANSEKNTLFKSEFNQVYGTLEDDEFEVTLKIIHYAKTQIQGIDDTIYLTLADHIHGLKQRFKNGIKLVNPLKNDIQMLYSEEYQIGLKALDIIDEYLFIRMDDDEAAFIALHLANACFFKDMGKLYDYMSVVKDITDRIHFHFKINYDVNSIPYFRFLSHIKYLSQKIASKENSGNEYVNSVIAQSIKSEMKDAYDFCVELAQFVKEKYSYEIRENDILYLSLNVEQIVRESQENQK